MKIFLIVMLLNLAGAGFANTPTTSLARGLAGTDKSTVFLPMLARGLVNLDMAIFSQAQAVLGMLTTEELEASFDSYPIRSALGMKLVTMISEADLEADNELTQLMDRLVFQANILGLSNDITTNDIKNAAESWVKQDYNRINNNDKNEIAKGVLETLIEKF